MDEVFVTPREQDSNFGFALWRTYPRVMKGFHHHNDVEMNLVLSGGLRYLHAGRVWPLRAGELAVFWAARPHQVVALDPGTRYYGLSVPLAWFHNWQLPRALEVPILRGDPVLCPDTNLTAQLRGHMEPWINDLQQDSVARRRALLLEMQAWFHRLGIVLSESSTQEREYFHGGDTTLDKVEAIARYVTEHYTEPLTVARVAEAIGLHPNYAVQLFRGKTGSTIVEFIAKQRLAHAQLLLTTTETGILDIALESGFGSSSRFYALFKDAYGCSPRAYRGMIREGRVPEAV